ncbi:MAG: ATP cone domain-containing protein [Planctomycetota bacterium]
MAPRRVRKRDGREVPFDPGKIADAIWKAAQSVGGEDRLLAEELASVVVHFLEREYGDRIPTIEDIQDLVEKVLIETGHARTAKAFILYREQRRGLREVLRVHKPCGVRAGSPSGYEGRLPVRSSARGASPPSLFLGDRIDVASPSRQMPWSKACIVEALVTESGLPAPLADEVASTVEARVFQSGLTRLSTSLIRELVDNELFERGLDLPLVQHSVIGLSGSDIEALLGSEGCRGIDVELACGRALLERHSLARRLPGTVVEAHLDGRLHLQALASPLRVVAASLAGGPAGSLPARGDVAGGRSGAVAGAKVERGREARYSRTPPRELCLDELAVRARAASGLVEDELLVHRVLARLVAERAAGAGPSRSVRRRRPLGMASLVGLPQGDRAARSLLLALVDPERRVAPGRVVLTMQRDELEAGTDAERASCVGALASLIGAAGELLSQAPGSGPLWPIPALRLELSAPLLAESDLLAAAALLEQAAPGCVAFVRPGGEAVLPRAPLGARVAVNLLRVVAAARGSPEGLEAEVDEAARLAAEACESRLRALTRLARVTPPGGIVAGDGGDDEPSPVASPTRGFSCLHGAALPWRAVLVPVLLFPALAYCAGSAWTPTGLAATGSDAPSLSAGFVGGASGLVDALLERLAQRFRAESEKLGFCGEMRLERWCEASQRLAAIEAEVDPASRAALEAVEGALGAGGLMGPEAAGWQPAIPPASVGPVGPRGLEGGEEGTDPEPSGGIIGLRESSVRERIERLRAMFESFSRETAP